MSAVVSPVLDSPRPMTSAQLDQLSMNCIRTLSMDAVQQAESPGIPERRWDATSLQSEDYAKP